MVLGKVIEGKDIGNAYEKIDKDDSSNFSAKKTLQHTLRDKKFLLSYHNVKYNHTYIQKVTRILTEEELDYNYGRAFNKYDISHVWSCDFTYDSKFKNSPLQFVARFDKNHHDGTGCFSCSIYKGYVKKFFVNNKGDLKGIFFIEKLTEAGGSRMGGGCADKYPNKNVEININKKEMIFTFGRDCKTMKRVNIKESK